MFVVVVLLLLGVVHAHMASPVDDHSWLSTAIRNEEADLAARKAQLMFYIAHPDAATKAQQDAAVWLSAWQPTKDDLLDLSKMGVTEFLTKEIESEQADLDAQRASYMELLANPEKLQEAESNLKIKSTIGNATLQSLLEDNIKEQEEALEARKAALEYFKQHPDQAAEAEKLREKVLERMVAEGDMTADKMEQGMKVGFVETLNMSITESESQLRSMRYALEILKGSSPGNGDASGGSSDSGNNELTTQQFGGGDFGRGRFGRDFDDRFGRGDRFGRDRGFDDRFRFGRGFDDRFGRGGRFGGDFGRGFGGGFGRRF